jgi:predicted DNA-binding transcriptional regulator AlpA
MSPLLPDSTPDPLEPADFAKVARVTPASVRRWAKNDPNALPPHFVIGSGPRARLRFRRADVEAWLEQQLSAQKNGEPLKPAA